MLDLGSWLHAMGRILLALQGLLLLELMLALWSLYLVHLLLSEPVSIIAWTLLSDYSSRVAHPQHSNPPWGHAHIRSYKIYIAKFIYHHHQATLPLDEIQVYFDNYINPH
jgi:hypothetical protein